MEIWGITDKGKVRRTNQDVFMTMTCEEKDVAVIVVCDGMGGARAGDVASSVAAERFMEIMRGYIDTDCGRDELAGHIPRAVTEANAAVWARSLSDPDCAGMGTTLVAAAALEDGEVVANIGDSRAYHVTDAEIRRVTRDHSVVEDMVDRGDITRDEVRTHPRRNLITRALGAPRGEPPDVFLLRMAQGDFLLLCSDGLSNVVAEAELAEEVRGAASVGEACRALLSLALSRGAPDNVTVVILKK